jgi:3-keto-L-gulonate-6-phosphate decarboxylase
VIGHGFGLTSDWTLVQARSLIEQLGKAMDESRQYASALEMTKRKTVETEKELLSMKSALDAAHKGLDDRNHRLADAQADLEKERLDIDIFKFDAWFLLLLQYCHHVSELVCCFLNVD